MLRPHSGIVLVLMAVCLLGGPDQAAAQRDLPPAKGGLTYELGMPPIYKGRSGFELGLYRPKTDSELSAYYDLGVSRNFGSPVVGIAGARIEGYLGLNSKDFDGGGRALFEVPSFHLGVGVDYSGTDEVFDALYALDLPLRRGGVFGRGTTFALRWLPTRDQSFSVGINVPLWGRNLGATRPRQDSVRLKSRKPKRLDRELADIDAELILALDELRERAGWVARLTQPFAEYPGADPHKAMAPNIAELTAHLDSTSARFPRGHSLPEEIRVYHETLDRTFTIAAGGRAAEGRAIGSRAREILLEEVLTPYNALIGQRKTDDSLTGMVAIAQTEFAGWVLSDLTLTLQESRRVFYVYQTLCDVMEENRRVLRKRWEDSRFVWLPLQFALTPDQHDSQAELDAITALAVGQEFTRNNRVWYVINEEFQMEMARSVREAEDYHVLWIHDFRGKNGEGEPDAIAYGQTLNYLEALIERVRAFDETNRLPEYFLFLDQHYFEVNKSRLWLRVLHDPLDYNLSLPGDHDAWEQQIRATQERLRAAVDESLLLRMGESQYGRKWLRNRIKVHINVTNPADPSFWSWHSIGIVPVPDNLMRDHRKIAFYDVTETDPYRGTAMFTGMGIGEHYVGANWEDRTIMIQGPGALAVKTAARGLLVAQGYGPDEIPFPLRRQDKPANYQALLDADAEEPSPGWKADRGGVLQLHNETGFHAKPINVAKAVQYSLMPAGSVLEVPDSLWQSYIYASLLAGSSLRGCHVLVIAPTEDSAPSAAPHTLAREHGLMGRIIVFSNAMERFITARGGLLKVGLYAPQRGVADIAGRFRQANGDLPDWAGEVFPENPAAAAVMENVDAILDSLGYEVKYFTGDSEVAKPKIHLKANFFASWTAWEALVTSPELANLVRAQIEYLAHQAGGDAGDSSARDVRDAPERLRSAWLRLIENMLTRLAPEQREGLIYYFTVGSTNMDYRSMVMDGEVQVNLAGWQSLFGFLDFFMLPGLCEWVETTEELDALLPPPSGITRYIAGLMKVSL